MDRVGICGTDVHFYSDAKMGPFLLKKPSVTRHKSSGVTVELGKNVQHLKVGDCCCTECNKFCLRCEQCRRSRYNICPKLQFCSLPEFDSVLSPYYAHSADFCFKIPDHLTMEEGALIEPFTVAVSAMRRADVEIGAEALILGCGPIGLANLAGLKAVGSTNICITDTGEERLKFASYIRTDHTLIATDKDPLSKLVEEIIKIMDSMPNRTFDCYGSEATMNLGIQPTSSGGILTLIGLAQNKMKLPLMEALAREIDIRDSFIYANAYPTAIALMASDKVNLKPLITHHFNIEQTEEL